MEEFRKALYQTCLKADIPILSRDTAAKILAVVYLQGGDERIVLSPKIKDEIEYIQDRFDIHGGETMDAELHKKKPKRMYVNLKNTSRQTTIGRNGCTTLFKKGTVSNYTNYNYEETDI